MRSSTVLDKMIKEVEQAITTLDGTIKDPVNWVCDIMPEIKDMTSDIKTFTEDLVKACKNPKANDHRVLRVIVKKFRKLVNEANNVVANYFAQEKKHGNNALAKSLNKISRCGKPNVNASEIQSIKEKVKTISEDHRVDLLRLMVDHPPPKVPQKLFPNYHISNYIICFNNYNEHCRAVFPIPSPKN